MKNLGFFGESVLCHTNGHQNIVLLVINIDKRFYQHKGNVDAYLKLRITTYILRFFIIFLKNFVFSFLLCIRKELLTNGATKPLTE